MTAVASLLVWVLGGVVEHECLNELPSCLFLQEHQVQNKKVWANSQAQLPFQVSKRLFYIQSKYMTDDTKSW